LSLFAVVVLGAIASEYDTVAETLAGVAGGGLAWAMSSRNGDAHESARAEPAEA